MDLAPVYPWHWNTAVFLNIFWCLPSEPQPCKEYGLQKEKLIPFIMQWIIILYAVCQSKCTDSVSQNHGCSYQNALVSRSVGFSKCWASPSVGSLQVLTLSKCWVSQSAWSLKMWVSPSVGSLLYTIVSKPGSHPHSVCKFAPPNSD